MSKFTRRETLAGMSALGTVAWTDTARADDSSSGDELKSNDRSQEIARRISEALLIDTHEHLMEERERLSGAPNPRIRSDDWTMLFSHYLDSDLIVSGMSADEHARFFSPQVAPRDKWKILEPFWPLVKNTGYARAVRISMAMLYDVDELSSATVEKLQSGYEKLRRPGFYRQVIRERGRIESCQVNSLTSPFNETEYPDLLMQDLSIVGMFAGPDFDRFGKPTGLEVRDLSDWHRVIDWWFDRYGKYAVAAKSQNAYARNIDYAKVEAEEVTETFLKILRRDPIEPAERKRLEDHLFWYAVGKATQHSLPVKLHTGYYAGYNSMPLGRLAENPAAATDLCRLSPETKFVLMHIGYPYYEELIAIAKHYSNAYIDLCWSWIINPIATKDFVKKLIVSAPINKLLPFGGDYAPVEPVLGHAEMARQGIAQALTELVEEKWLSMADALELIEPIMNGNARRLFHLDEKRQVLAQAFWK